MAEAVVKRNGWRQVAFGDVVRLAKVRSRDPDADGFERYVGLEHLDPGDLRIRRWGKVADGTTFTSVFRPGQVLFGKRRAYQRKVALADFAGVCSGDIYVFESKDPDVLDPLLLPFICQTDAFVEHAVGTSAGSLSPRTNWKSLAEYEFALPPIHHQRKSTEVLLACEQLAASLQVAASKSESTEFAHLLETFGHDYGVSALGFPLVPLAKVAEIRTGLAKGRRPDATTTTRPYLRVANVKDGNLDLDEVKEIVVEKAKVSRYGLQPGDVLMTEGGDLDKLGRGTVWQGEIDGCLHQNHVFAVRTDHSLLNPWYLAALARSPYGRAFFQQSAKRTNNLASVNKKQLSGFLVPLMPGDAQREWLDSYSRIRESHQVLRTRIYDLGLVRRGLMERVFGA